MIEIIQRGQPAAAQSLHEMHRLRKIIFKDRMKWDVNITKDGLEIDNYDINGTIYILARNEKGQIVGCWRAMPTSGPSMIREIWPQFLDSLPMPYSDNVWEVSRFGVHSFGEKGTEFTVISSMISSLIQTALFTNITHIYTLYNKAIGRTIKQVGWVPDTVSDELPVDGVPTVIARFPMTYAALRAVQDKSGVRSLIYYDDLPPILRSRIYQDNQIQRKATVYA